MTAATLAEDRRIEEASLNYLHSRRQLLYDGWLLFLSPGKAKRARSVSAHYASTLPLDEKVAFCEGVYRRCGLPALFRITPFSQPDGLDEALAALGFDRFDDTLVQAVALEEPPPAVALPEAQLESPLAEAFVEVVGALRGSPPGQRSAHLERLLQSPLHVVPLVARVAGQPVAAGLASVDGPFAGLFDIVVAPDLRRRGYARALVARLLARSWERGARAAYLQVDSGNHAAVELYRGFGFATRYRYHYRARAGGFA